MGVNEPRKTIATRTLPGGSFTPAQSQAASNPCLNCGTNVQLDYCPECGQAQVDPDPTLREFLRELAEEFLHWDGKLGQTFRTLVTQPGQLTREYLEGRRIRYVSPLRVYLSCSVLFFFMSTVIPERTIVDASGHRVVGGVVQVGASSPAELAEVDSLAQQAPAIQRIWFAHFARAMRTPRELAHAVTSSIPKAMFVLVPLFAALLGVVYRDRRRRYPQHLAFALHEHAMMFLVLTALLAVRLLPSLAAAMAVELAGAVVLSVRLVRATRVVYGGSAGEATWRLTLASAMYFFAFVAALFATFAVTVLMF